MERNEAQSLPLLDAEATEKPLFDAECVKTVIESRYEMKVKQLKSLPSYDDQNFRVTPTEGQQRFVFKITSTKQEFLEALHEITTCINEKSSSSLCPRVIPTKKGEFVFEQQQGSASFVHCPYDLHNADQKQFRCLLMTFMEGKTLVDLISQPLSDEAAHLLFSEIGRRLGEMDRILARECHSNATKRVLHYWDLGRTLEIKPLVCKMVIPDAKRLEMIHETLHNFETSFLPRMGEFRKSIIQNDANSSNIIVKQEGLKWHVHFIDFLDMIETCTVFNIAISLSYLMKLHAKPLVVAKALLGGYHQENALSDAEIEVLPVLIKARIATSVTLCARKRFDEPDNEYLSIDEKTGWDCLEYISNFDKDSLILLLKSYCLASFPLPPLNKSIQDIQEKRQLLLSSNLSISYSQSPLKIVRGYMQYLYNEAGEVFLDAVNNVCHVGHCHPKVVTFAQRQMAQLNTNTRYLHDYIIDYSQDLCGTFPDPLSVCFLVCSGSEANELALRLARCHTKRENILVMDHGYHGNTGMLVSLSPYKCEGKGGEGLAAFARKAPLPDVYRGCYSRDEEDVGRKYAELAVEAMDSLQESGGLAAFIAESILGCAGQVVFPDGYLEHMYKLVRERGGVCIADEVQVGFGRCGQSWWAFEPQNVVPDIVTLGKPIGNGHPIGAVITTPDIARSFCNGMEYFNTFGGNPVSCAVAMAVLDVVRKEKLIEHAKTEGEFLLRSFQLLQETYSFIGDVRGIGFYLGIEIVSDKSSKTPDAHRAFLIVQQLKDQFHILISTDGPYHNVLKLKPPMVFSHSDAVYLVQSLQHVANSLITN